MTSPWATIAPIQSVDFQEIQSEQYARSLQDKEESKFSKYLAEQVMDHRTAIALQINENEPSTSSSLPSASSLTSAEPSSSDTFLAHEQALIATKNEVPFNLDDFCDSDRIIAEMLQAEFDRDHDNELKRYEQKTNKDCKVSVSFKNYRKVPEELLYDSDDEYDMPDDRKSKDSFDLNEKVMNKLSKKGFGYDEDGLMITKHDATLSGVRNACRVMSFPPEFQTGDTVDMKLSNAVFNQLRTYSRKSKKHKAHDRKENIATAEMGVDERTRIILYKLISNQYLQEINGIISTGKEALILHAESDPSFPGDFTPPKYCAIKIFKTTLNEFKQRDRYIKDDFRFKERFGSSKQNTRAVIHMWAEKEMYNLNRMRKHGINCPHVVILKKHVLVMSFIGVENVAAPKLKEAILSDAELSVAYEEIVDMMYRLYNDAKLVHADLSEYNILWHDNRCWFIDVAQSVEPEHPSGLEFMMRDCDNICTFFTRRGVPNVKTKEELFSYITGLDSFAHNAAMLERMHGKGPTMAIATAPNFDDMPESLKPISYPFDYAWQKSTESKVSKEVKAKEFDSESEQSNDYISVGVN